ncbi:MAG: response regulator [Candidatus Sericytochromatia bacterium]
MSASILIVDDVPTNIQLVASILAPFDYELSFANSGADALAQISETGFDLILLDIMMPGMDGLEVARRLKDDETTGHIPIIFLTAKSDEDSIIEGFTVGAADYVTKPFNPAELVARVQTHLALKQTQDELRRRNLELAEAIQLKNRLLSIAAHDLKNPLSAVSGFAAMLERNAGVQADTDAPEMVNFIARAAGRMTQLIGELLDTAALEMGRMELNLSNCEPQLLLYEVLLDNRPLAEKKAQSLEFSGSSSSIYADSRRLKQIFDNLVSNAIKYSPNGAKIQVSMIDQPEALEIRVSDQGPGFTHADRSQLFGYFQRLSARPTGGEVSTGVGLAIVKQIVELHQGEISLESSSPQGSTFLVRLPRQSAGAEAGRQP